MQQICTLDIAVNFDYQATQKQRCRQYKTFSALSKNTSARNVADSLSKAAMNGQQAGKEELEEFICHVIKQQQ